METEKYTDKLAKYIIFAAVAVIVGAACWYFKNILIYILIAVVMSLMAKPIMKLLRKVCIKGRRMPEWLMAALSIVLILVLFLAVITLIFPIVSGIVKGISLENIESAARHIAGPMSDLNIFLRQTFPQLGSDFRIELAVMQELQKLLNVSIFSSVIGSAASLLSSFGVGLFSVVFIGFFFIKDEDLFGKMITAVVPDKHEDAVFRSLSDISHLLSRYFDGLLLEMSGVAFLNFLGLLLIARLGFNASIGIAFLTGLLNIIPYVGPLAGGVFGTALGLVLKYSSVAPIGLNVSFLWFTIILIAIFCFTQLVDNFLFQPVIYSTSIKASPLEIFIVLLIAGHVSGPLGMIVAIPCYTVARVVAFRFFADIKAIRRLMPQEEAGQKESKQEDNQK
ncbi:MAG: AI-2E family transporter [Candidatus Cryptobacteroides sp.]